MILGALLPVGAQQVGGHARLGHHGLEPGGVGRLEVVLAVVYAVVPFAVDSDYNGRRTGRDSAKESVGELKAGEEQAEDDGLCGCSISSSAQRERKVTHSNVEAVRAIQLEHRRKS